jgi:hypothetical protein
MTLSDEIEKELLKFLELNLNELDLEDKILNFLTKIQKYIENSDFDVKKTQTAIFVFISNFIKYSSSTSNSEIIINSIINDEGKDTNFDYRPNFKKIDEIESLSKDISKKLHLDSLSKHFFDENERKKEENYLNLYEYYTTKICKQNENRIYINSFLNLLQLIKFPDFNEYLIMLSIKISLKLIESFTINYDDKLAGLEIINCMIQSTSKTDLSVNNRTLLILNTIERFVYEKDSIKFLYQLLKTQLSLLDIHETQYAANEHDYKLHSKYFNNLLDNCRMCSNLNVKIVYFLILKGFLKQMKDYMVKYLSKLFDILLVDTVDYMKSNINYKYNYVLIKLIFSIVEICLLQFECRVHAHAKMIIQFLIKFIYYLCLDYSDEDGMEFDVKFFENYNTIIYNDSMNEVDDKYYCLKYCFKLLVCLFKNDKVKFNEYNEFLELKFIQSNDFFKICIDFISKKVHE